MLSLDSVRVSSNSVVWTFFFQAEDGIRDRTVTGVQTCALPIWPERHRVVSAPVRAGRARRLYSRPPPTRGFVAFRPFGPTPNRHREEPTMQFLAQEEIGRASCRERVWREGDGRSWTHKRCGVRW